MVSDTEKPQAQGVKYCAPVRPPPGMEFAFRSSKACGQKPGFCVLFRVGGVYGGGGRSVSAECVLKGFFESSVISGAFDMLGGEGGGESRKLGFWRRSRSERSGRIGLLGAQKCEDGFSKKEEDERYAGAGWARVRVDM
jgi:hypothetical protein